MNIVEIKQRLSGAKPFLAEEFHVSKIGVFGSYARGEQKDSSDVDLLVEFNTPVGFFKFMDLSEFLEGLLGKKVDLVTRKALKPHIGRNILKELMMV
jgi:predicted nucleotidyltransferase